jgi:hypothetical protein
LSDWTVVLSSALVYGLVLSAALTILMIISGAIALDMWVGDYPADIRQKYGPMSHRARRLRPFFATAIFAVVLVVLFLGLFDLRTGLGVAAWIPALAFGALTLLVFNLFDLLVLDWLFFCTIQPRAMVLPGTEGMAGYRDYRFHFIGFLKGLGFCAVGGPIVGGLWMLLQPLFT